MLFVAHTKIETENRDAVYKRFQKIGNGEVEGVKLLGTWHSLTQDENWSILESSDAIQIAKLFHKWTDLALTISHRSLTTMICTRCWQVLSAYS